MEFSRQGYWSGLPVPSPGDLPDLGIKPGSPAAVNEVVFFWGGAGGRYFTFDSRRLSLTKGIQTSLRWTWSWLNKELPVLSSSFSQKGDNDVHIEATRKHWEKAGICWSWWWQKSTGIVVLESKGWENILRDPSTPGVPQLLLWKASLSLAPLCKHEGPLQWSHKKSKTRPTAWPPPGPVFHSCFWTQPCFPYKLWVNCGPCSCGRGLRDQAFLSAVPLAFCHNKV